MGSPTDPPMPGYQKITGYLDPFRTQYGFFYRFIVYPDADTGPKSLGTGPIQNQQVITSVGFQGHEGQVCSKRIYDGEM